VLDNRLPVPSLNGPRINNLNPAVGGAPPVGGARPQTFDRNTSMKLAFCSWKIFCIAVSLVPALIGIIAMHFAKRAYPQRITRIVFVCAIIWLFLSAVIYAFNSDLSPFFMGDHTVGEETTA